MINATSSMCQGFALSFSFWFLVRTFLIDVEFASGMKNINLVYPYTDVPEFSEKKSQEYYRKFLVLFTF